MVVVAMEMLSVDELNWVAQEALVPLLTNNGTTAFWKTLQDVVQSDSSVVLTNTWVGYDALNFDATHGDDFAQLCYCGIGRLLDALGIETVVLLPLSNNAATNKNQQKLQLLYAGVIGYNVDAYGDLDEAVEKINKLK